MGGCEDDDEDDVAGYSGISEDQLTEFVLHLKHRREGGRGERLGEVKPSGNWALRR